MIIDKLTNIELYTNLPKEVISFIKNYEEITETGRFVLSENAYVNVETYLTKSLADAKYESHDKYIDIQFLLKGKERIFYTQRSSLESSIPYNSEKDITFYRNKVVGDFVELDGANFFVIYPHEAHAPQVCSETPENVLKVVVKVKLVS